MHATVEEFLRHLETEGRASTVPAYERGLRRFSEWLVTQSLDPLAVTLEVLIKFQTFLAEEYRKPNAKPLKRSTQVTWLASIKSYYRWLYRTNRMPFDPARKLKLPKVHRRKVACDHLNQQEVIAILQTQAAIVAGAEEGSRKWAFEYRNLALLALAFATGRRRASLRDLRVQDLNLERNEVRVEWEKGRPGRVLPCCTWAMDVAKNYIEKARPILVDHLPTAPEWLFVSVRMDRICGEYLGRLLRQVQAATVEENPDLEELAAKKFTSHSTRVSFATMLFLNGAGIRIVNELLLHKQLSTSAKYTPLALDDLRRACRTAHPRA